MGEGVRYGGSVAGPEEVGAAADGQVGSLLYHSATHYPLLCPLQCTGGQLGAPLVDH